MCAIALKARHSTRRTAGTEDDIIDRIKQKNKASIRRFWILVRNAMFPEDSSWNLEMNLKRAPDSCVPVQGVNRRSANQIRHV